MPFDTDEKFRKATGNIINIIFKKHFNAQIIFDV